MPYKEKTDKDLKTYYTVGEVAEAVHQATSALRFWEGQFPFLNPAFGKSGHRQYTRKDFQIVLDINFLLNGMGMTMEGVRQAFEYKYIDQLKEIYKKKVRNEYYLLD